MEGETKDALYELINSKVKTFVYQDLPAALRGMAELLEANRQNFETLINNWRKHKQQRG